MKFCQSQIKRNWAIVIRVTHCIIKLYKTTCKKLKLRNFAYNLSSSRKKRELSSFFSLFFFGKSKILSWLSHVTFLFIIFSQMRLKVGKINFTYIYIYFTYISLFITRIIKNCENLVILKTTFRICRNMQSMSFLRLAYSPSNASLRDFSVSDSSTSKIAAPTRR